MSLKAIEMQIALPRSVDASKLQDQLMQRGQLTNDYGNLKMQQEEVKQRTTVVKQEQKDPAKFHHDRENAHSGNQHEASTRKKLNQKKNKSLGKHPYKGNFLDYSG